MTQTSDEALMLAFSEGCLQSFNTLFERHKGSLYRYFLRNTQDPHLSEDLYQEVWSRIIKSAPDYQPKARFTTWLFTLAHNKLVDQFRHIKLVTQVVVEESEDTTELADISACPESMALDFTSSQALKSCLKKLPALQLDTFLLKEEAGLKVQDIAEITGCQLQACKSRLRYAYQSLKQCLTTKLGRSVA